MPAFMIHQRWVKKNCGWGDISRNELTGTSKFSFIRTANQPNQLVFNEFLSNNIKSSDQWKYKRKHKI